MEVAERNHILGFVIDIQWCDVFMMARVYKYAPVTAGGGSISFWQTYSINQAAIGSRRSVLFICDIAALSKFSL